MPNVVVQHQSVRTRYTRAAAVALLSCVGLTAAWAQSAWVPNETRVTAQPDLFDAEFSQKSGLLIWNSEDGKLWAAQVDRRTGNFIPENGKGVLIDDDTMTFQDAQKTKNGPEFVASDGGEIVVYTKYAGRHTDGNSRIGIAQQAPDGSWSWSLMGPEVRKAPYGSLTDDDPNPRITYVDNRENHYWRDLWNPATEQLIADFPASNYPIYHVRGARAVLYPLNVDGIDQVFHRDLDSGVVTQLTFDPGQKYQMFMWRAPEFNDELVFFTLVDEIEMRMYRQLPDPSTGELVWTAVMSHVAPEGNKMYSPEPFTYNGHSYAFMSQSVPGIKFRSEIWIANFKADAPIFRRITDNRVLKTRTDPEVFITDSGPMIYFNRLEPEQGRNGRPKSCRKPYCSDGVWRADPGPLNQ